MTVKEEAHQLLDQLPDHITWEELLTRIRTAASRHLELSGGRPQNAKPATQRSTAVRDPAARELELEQFLEREIWPQIPTAVLGKPLTKEAREEILGYGPAGV
jgi:hypothetical protein